jgi:ribosomal protein S18 acetylase RimI-like enzyme
MFKLLGGRQMYEIRLAQKGEISQQKEIWKLCFGDSEQYIDSYFAARYKEAETLLMLEEGKIISMLTMLPNKIAIPNSQGFSSTMLYAIATHPQYQHRGYASQLIDFAHQYLNKRENHITVLVPAEEQLFEYYRHLGYQDGFYIRETMLAWDKVEGMTADIIDDSMSIIRMISPQEYNQRRDIQLRAKFYISYTDEDIAYQKLLSQQSAADIYGLDFEGELGCTVIERLNPDRVMIKELLVSEEFLVRAVKCITQIAPAKEYILRTPVFLGRKLESITHSIIRPFAMYRTNQKNGFHIKKDDAGYLGIAFD